MKHEKSQIHIFILLNLASEEGDEKFSVIIAASPVSLYNMTNEAEIMFIIFFIFLQLS